MEQAIEIAFKVAILIFAVVIHEVSHGYTALVLGDRTALAAGRLTLNPLKHLDPLGSVVLPALMVFLRGPVFGWAKPIPYNPYNFRNPELGSLLVGVAGPAANFLVAAAAGLTIRFLPVSESAFFVNFVSIATYVAFINLFLCVFNLLPIPPLDGSKLLFFFFPPGWDGTRAFLEQYGFLMLLFLIFFLGAGGFLLSIAETLFRVLAGGSAGFR